MFHELMNNPVLLSSCTVMRAMLENTVLRGTFGPKRDEVGTCSGAGG
jgi:hypothetical protein